MPHPTVEVTTSGRGGAIYYREGGHTVSFDWEFALPPALALIMGPAAPVWDRAHPWAAGRQAEICQFVAAEVVRQKAPGSTFNIDLDTGSIELISPRGPAGRPSPTAAQSHPAARSAPAFKRLAEQAGGATGAEVGEPGYDLALVEQLDSASRDRLVDLITRRGVKGRDMELLAALDTGAARSLVDAGLRDHLSIDVRLAAADVMYRQGRLADLESVLVRQIYELSLPANGLERALALATRFPTPSVRQALLWASCNRTDCAPRCAARLLELCGVGREPFEEPVREMLRKIGPHNSSFDRQDAFRELCRLVGMELDPDAAQF
jgi:hypothetical protein